MLDDIMQNYLRVMALSMLIIKKSVEGIINWLIKNGANPIIKIPIINKPAANLSVWLVSLPWNSSRRAKTTDNIITRGWADPQNYKSLTESEPLKTGKFYDVTFDLQPDDQIIKAGQQIGLLIFSSDKEYTLHPKPGTELTIDLDGTHLNLPVVGGAEIFNKAFKD